MIEPLNKKKRIYRIRQAKRKLAIETINLYEGFRESGCNWKSSLRSTLIEMKLANRKDYD